MTGASTAAQQSLASRARAGLLAIPGVRLIRTYDRGWLPTDAMAALTVWALLVPQALAYAQLGASTPSWGCTPRSARWRAMSCSAVSGR